MLIFYCTDCKETINGADDEHAGEILDRLDQHRTKCPLATFTFEGTTNLARERVDDMRAVIAYNRVEAKLRLH
jgi:hypothetical protein